MTRGKYDRLVDEVYDCMSKPGIDKALALKYPSQRLDGVVKELREGLLRSSLHKFGGCVYFFGGEIYEELSYDDFGNLVYDVLRRCKLPNGDYGRIEGVFKVCRRVVGGKQLEIDNSLMAFRNCVVNTATREAHEFSRDLVCVNMVDYDYNPDDKVFLWEEFLKVVLPSKGLRDVLQEFLGSIFVNRKEAKLENMLVLKGSGSNGKSVVFETIMGILGRENVSNFGISALVSGSERKKNIAFINGKRLNYCSEIQALEFGKGSDMLKALISGEPVEARAMYGENFTAYDIPLLMANANQMPKLKDLSYGMRRRIMIIPFKVEIPVAQQQKNLAQELRLEYPAIFNWICEGRERFVKRGYKFTVAREIEDVMDEYMSDSCTPVRFMVTEGFSSKVQGILDVAPRWVVVERLYRRYVRWCAEMEVDKESRIAFSKALIEAGYQKKRTKEGMAIGVYGKAKLIEVARESLAAIEGEEEETPMTGEEGEEAEMAAEMVRMDSLDAILPELRGGKIVIRTIKGAAMQVGASPQHIRKLMDKGLLKDLWWMDDCDQLWFDVEGLQQYFADVDRRAREAKEEHAKRKKRKVVEE